MGSQNGSTWKSAWWPEFDPWESRGRRQESATSGPSSGLHMGTVIHTHKIDACDLKTFKENFNCLSLTNVFFSCLVFFPSLRDKACDEPFLSRSMYSSPNPSIVSRWSPLFPAAESGHGYKRVSPGSTFPTGGLGRLF